MNEHRLVIIEVEGIPAHAHCTGCDWEPGWIDSEAQALATHAAAHQDQPSDG